MHGDMPGAQRGPPDARPRPRARGPPPKREDANSRTQTGGRPVAISRERGKQRPAGGSVRAAEASSSVSDLTPPSCKSRRGRARWGRHESPTGGWGGFMDTTRGSTQVLQIGSTPRPRCAYPKKTASKAPTPPPDANDKCPDMMHHILKAARPNVAPRPEMMDMTRRGVGEADVPTVVLARGLVMCGHAARRPFLGRGGRRPGRRRAASWAGVLPKSDTNRVPAHGHSEGGGAWGGLVRRGRSKARGKDTCRGHEQAKREIPSAARRPRWHHDLGYEVATDGAFGR